MVEDAGDFFGRIEPPAISIHFENNGGCAVALGNFHGPAQEHEQRR